MTLFKIPVAPVFLPPTPSPHAFLAPVMPSSMQNPEYARESHLCAFANPFLCLETPSPPSCPVNSSSWTTSSEKYSPDRASQAFPALGFLGTPLPHQSSVWPSLLLGAFAVLAFAFISLARLWVPQARRTCLYPCSLCTWHSTSQGNHSMNVCWMSEL